MSLKIGQTGGASCAAAARRSSPVPAMRAAAAARPPRCEAVARAVHSNISPSTQQQQRPKPARHLGGSVVGAAAAAVVAAASLLGAAPPCAAATPTETFALKCAGCHMNGGNVLAAGATLFTADLERNGRATADAVYDIIYRGKGKMPGFGAECAPKGACTFGPRFTDDEVRAQAQYVLARAAEGWKAAEAPAAAP